jgi:hypothetical protein
MKLLILYEKFEKKLNMKNSVCWDVTRLTPVRNERIASISRVNRIGELGTTLTVTNN